MCSSQDASVQRNENSKSSGASKKDASDNTADPKGFDLLTMGALLIKFMLLVSSDEFKNMSWENKAKHVAKIMEVCSDNQIKAGSFFEH